MNTRNLNDSDDGMVPFRQAQAQPQPKQQEKNIMKEQITMDSTPIADIMGPDMMELPQDPRMIPQVYAPAPSAQKQAASATASKNPMNLTDEQMQALVAGVCAVLAFSRPVQEKLASAIPQVLGDGGSVSSVGLILTGLIAALLFYFGKRFVINKPAA